MDMSINGFGKNSGPTGRPKVTPPFGYLPRSPSPPPPIFSAPPRQPSPWPVRPSSKFDDHGSPSAVMSFTALHDNAVDLPTNNSEVQYLKGNMVPDFISTGEEHLQSLGTHIGRPVLPSSVSGNKSNLPNKFPHPLTQQNPPLVSTRFREDSGRNSDVKHVDIQLPKRTRSPPLPSTIESAIGDSLSGKNDSRRPSLSPPGSNTWPSSGFGTFDSQSHWSPPSAHINNNEVAETKPKDFPVPKRSRLPSPSSDPFFHVSSYSGEDDTERELQAKAKRLARFKDELSQSEESNPGTRNQKLPSKRLDQSMVEKRKFIGEPLDMAGDFRSGNLSADYESLDSSSVIIGYCPDMCPEPERAERERKGDLDQYERLDGDRNQTSISLAVKKYNRTAEREADLIRPMPILQKTMSYLLNLLDQPYDDRLLGLYNFLWDRMRAIRMDLRMQHIFNLGAITMLEQMIRLHILAMHELCQYARGEGFSEGFDAHLNIEQMNKTSVELFQLYDDHRKKGTNVATEKEFRGYYALLKLDKHPGYKVEPAELSLDLAKMTPEIRQTSEILFARDVARSCRAGNFIAFFRLARKASYLQACLMHAHFGKLRSLALASLHSGLQNNQGIPVSQVSKWLGMEEENIEDLLEYHGFLIKEFEEPYMVKEGPFMNVDNEYPLKRSKLVDMKKSNKIVEDVSSPSLMETLFSEDVKRFQVDKANVQEVSPARFKDTENPARAIDYEMPIYEALSSPKNDMQMKPMSKNLATDIWHDDQDNMDVVSPSLGDISKATLSSPASMTIDVVKSNYDTRFRNSLERSVHTNVNAVMCTQTIDSPKAMITDVGRPNYDIRFRNSIEKNVQPNVDLTSLKAMPITLEPEGLPYSRMDSSIEDSVEQPVSVKDFGPEQHISMFQEVESYKVDTIDFDEEIALAKLKLILRIWRRRSSKKKEVREQRQLAANAALSKLSLGAPLWHYKEQPSIPGEFNIDRALNERCKKQEQSWSTLNVSKVIADKLSQLNPCSGCLCWKIIFCSLDEVDGDKIEQMGRISYLDAAPWLRSKLMPDGIGSIDDLLISSPGLAIWKNWVYSQSIGDLTCCLSVIKEMEFDNLDGTLAGASSVLFLVSGCIPWAIQRSRLHNLTMAIPSGSHLPLLILSGCGKNDSDFSTIVINLGLDEVDKSRISTYSVVPLVKEQQPLKHFDSFFSDEQLRKGLQWLASESPLQPRVHGVKTRELVLAHFNRLASVLEQFDAYDISPNHCISAINGALDQSIEEIANAAKSNPTCWPCPEISLLEGSCEEHRAIELYLPEVGWSSDARMEKLISTLDSCRLPNIVNETSWRWTGANMGIDIENQKLDLEDFLIKYLTESTRLMGFPLAQKEASIMLQKCTTLKLRDLSYHILPNWYMIFRRVFNWQLMNLSDGVLATSYVTEQDIASIANSSGRNKLELEGVMSTPYSLISPSLDEMVEVCCSSDLEYIQPLLPMVHNAPEVQRIVDENHSVEEERYSWEDSKFAGTKDNAATNGATNISNELSVSPKIRNEADRLSWLVEQCNLVQNMNQKKLSLYF